MDLQDALQPQALLVAGDLARDAGVLERRHVDHVAARQRDVGSDARALGSERLLGDLDNDLLAFLQQFGDGRQGRSFRAADRFAARVAAARLSARVQGLASVDSETGAASVRSEKRGSPCPPPRILRRMRRGMRCGESSALLADLSRQRRRVARRRGLLFGGGVGLQPAQLPTLPAIRSRLHGRVVRLCSNFRPQSPLQADRHFHFRPGGHHLALFGDGRVVWLLGGFLGDFGQSDFGQRFRLGGTLVSCRSRISSSSASSSG